jgi:hypothetical protein
MKNPKKRNAMNPIFVSAGNATPYKKSGFTKTELASGIAFLAFMANGCQSYYCPAFDKDGNPLIGKEKVKDADDCKYGKKPDEPSETLDPEIKSITDLKNKLEQIKKELSGGKTVALKMLDQLATTEEQFDILKEFGGLQKQYGNKLIIDWNGKDVCPAKSGVLLNFYEWDVEMNKMPLGVGESGGAKAVIQWDIGENELQLFIDAGANGPALAPGNAVITINTYDDLHNAPAAIINGYQPGKPTRLKFNQTLPEGFRNGADAFALRELCAGQAKGKWEYQNLNSQKKQFWANDSINVGYATVVHGMEPILQPTPLGGKKHAFIQYVGPNSLDSVPNSQVVRVAQRNSNQLNLTKVVPNQIDIVHEWNVGQIPGQFWGWHKDIKLVAASRPHLRGGRQNVVGVDDIFLNHLRIPIASELYGASPVLYSSEDLMLALYDRPPPPPGHKDMNVSELNFGCNNYSETKLGKSYLDGECDDYTCARSALAIVTVNVQTDRPECIASDGKVIVNAEWLRGQSARYLGITNKQVHSLVISNYKLYLTGPALDIYIYIYIYKSMR